MAIVSGSCFRHLGLRLTTHLAFVVIAEDSNKMESEGCTQSMRLRLLFDSGSNGAFADGELCLFKDPRSHR